MTMTRTLVGGGHRFSGRVVKSIKCN